MSTCNDCADQVDHVGVGQLGPQLSNKIFGREVETELDRSINSLEKNKKMQKEKNSKKVKKRSKKAYKLNARQDGDPRIKLLNSVADRT